MCTQAARGRLEAEACAAPTLRGGGSKDTTRVAELLRPGPWECLSIAMEQGQQKCSSLSSSGYTYEAVASRKGTNVLDSNSIGGLPLFVITW